MPKLIIIILLVSCIEYKDHDDMLENETNDNNILIGVLLLFNGNVFDLAVAL